MVPWGSPVTTLSRLRHAALLAANAASRAPAPAAARAPAPLRAPSGGAGHPPRQPRAPDAQHLANQHVVLAQGLLSQKFQLCQLCQLCRLAGPAPPRAPLAGRAVLERARARRRSSPSRATPRPSGPLHIVETARAAPRIPASRPGHRRLAWASPDTTRAPPIAPAALPLRRPPTPPRASRIAPPSSSRPRPLLGRAAPPRAGRAEPRHPAARLPARRARRAPPR